MDKLYTLNGMNKAISLVVFALVVVALILILGVGLFLNSTYNTAHTTGTSPNNTTTGIIATLTTTTIYGSGDAISAKSSSLLSNSTTSWQVLKTNVTVRYDAGCMVFEAVGHTCPTKGANTTTSSLTGVELIQYRGIDYYAGNFSAGPYGQTAVPYLTVWFTNTTIYCISPKDNYPACP